MFRLFLTAITDRLHLTSSRCPYCGLPGKARWPWQGANLHVRIWH